MAKVLVGNFKGTKGDQGDIGPQGIQGPTGPGGPQGPKGDTGPVNLSNDNDKVEAEEYALNAVQNNPNIEGTLANMTHYHNTQVSNFGNFLDLYNISRDTVFTDMHDLNLLLPVNIHCFCTVNTDVFIQLRDVLPEKYGILEVIKGYNDGYCIFYFHTAVRGRTYQFNSRCQDSTKPTYEVKWQNIYFKEDIPFRFGVTSDGECGYIKPGADTVTPFLSSVEFGNITYDYTRASFDAELTRSCSRQAHRRYFCNMFKSSDYVYITARIIHCSTEKICLVAQFDDSEDNTGNLFPYNKIDVCKSTITSLSETYPGIISLCSTLNLTDDNCEIYDTVDTEDWAWCVNGITVYEQKDEDHLNASNMYAIPTLAIHKKGGKIFIA